MEIDFLKLKAIVGDDHDIFVKPYDDTRTYTEILVVGNREQEPKLVARLTVYENKKMYFFTRHEMMDDPLLDIVENLTREIGDGVARTITERWSPLHEWLRMIGYKESVNERALFESEVYLVKKL